MMRRVTILRCKASVISESRLLRHTVAHPMQLQRCGMQQQMQLRLRWCQRLIWLPVPLPAHPCPLFYGVCCDIMVPSEPEAEQQVQAQDNSSLCMAHLACSLIVIAGSRLRNAESKLEIIVSPWRRRKQLKPEERH